MSIEIEQGTFKAWVNEMPGGRYDLHVKGEMIAPSGGWTARLAVAQPQGINPTILILDLKTTKPSGPATGQRVPIAVSYDGPNANYRQVTIHSDSTAFTIDVGHAH